MYAVRGVSHGAEFIVCSGRWAVKNSRTDRKSSTAHCPLYTAHCLREEGEPDTDGAERFKRGARDGQAERVNVVRGGAAGQALARVGVPRSAAPPGDDA